MTSADAAQRLSHAELSSPADMVIDCAAIGRHLDLPTSTRVPAYRTSYVHDQAKPSIHVTEAAQRLANALHLHLD